MTPIALWYFIEHSTAWIQFKSFTITAAFVVALAFAGAAALQREPAARRQRCSAGSPRSSSPAACSTATR